MKALQKTKKNSKKERETHILFGVIDYYISTGKPVGSNTLKETGFENISSATIRNYFASLEEEGYLHQHHASGGRVPTEAAFRLYAEHASSANMIEQHEKQLFDALKETETKEIASFLQQAAESLSNLTECAVFLSAPRFDHDFLVNIKLVSIDHERALCVMISDFGVVKTELIHLDKKLSAFAIKRIEEYFHWRLTGHDKPENLEKEEEETAQRLYNEVMVRYIIGYAHFTDEDIHRTGFSKLLAYPDFHDPKLLANSLSLFENAQAVRHLLRECSSTGTAKCWIGKDFTPYTQTKTECSVIAYPYRINQQIVGAVGILGPIRIPYKKLFAVVKAFTEAISDALTRNIYKFKIDYRQANIGQPYLPQEEQKLLGQSQTMLIEDKSQYGRSI
ncbi:MAG: heat-inducible transcriptional repressor HrcA [Chlamydiales bacterium]|nr:heat-inducible transcriptional repressor HrcA [Chlamydiia bacterium]MCP5507703.1 heat-inducible transcriptional repressor HrcA [Chlamydiales bacterium]